MHMKHGICTGFIESYELVHNFLCYVIKLTLLLLECRY